MAVGGVGWDVSKKSPKLLFVTNGTVDEKLRTSGARRMWLAFSPSTSATLFGVSARVPHTAGIDLSRPFFFPPNDPRFNEILTRVRRERDARIARLRRDKKKFAAAKARGRRQDIVVAPRAKDITYQLATPEMS
jgi:hypothetical protein